MEVGAAGDRPEREPRRDEGGAHFVEWVDVAANLGDQVGGRLAVLVLAAAGDQPVGGACVDGIDVELVDQQRAPGLQRRRERLQRLGQRLDVMQRDGGDRGVEPGGGASSSASAIRSTPGPASPGSIAVTL